MRSKTLSYSIFDRVLRWVVRRLIRMLGHVNQDPADLIVTIVQDSPRRAAHLLLLVPHLETLENPDMLPELISDTYAEVHEQVLMSLGVKEPPEVIPFTTIPGGKEENTKDEEKTKSTPSVPPPDLSDKGPFS